MSLFALMYTGPCPEKCFIILPSQHSVSDESGEIILIPTARTNVNLGPHYSPTLSFNLASRIVLISSSFINVDSSNVVVKPRTKSSSRATPFGTWDEVVRLHPSQTSFRSVLLYYVAFLHLVP